MNTASFVISVLSFAMAAVALFVSLRKERKRLSVRGRHYVIAPDPGMPYQERHIEVIAVNRRHRPITVMELGMYVQGEDGEFKRIDGKTRPKLHATLGDGDIALMSWTMDEWESPGNSTPSALPGSSRGTTGGTRSKVR